MTRDPNMDDLDELRMGPAARRASEKLVEQGLRVVPRTIGADIPKLPRDVTSLHDEALMELWGQFTSYTDYMAVQAACADADRRDAERKLEAQSARATLGDVADAKESAKESATRAKARRDADPKTIELAERLDELTAYAKLCNVLMNNLDRDSQFLSRELTRRVGGVNTSARASRRA